MERFQLELDLETKKYLKGQIDKITEEFRRMSHEEPWAEKMLYLMQIPGFGVVTGMTVLAAIGDIARFDSPKKLASYSGLAPGVEQSGVKLRGKGITSPTSGESGPTLETVVFCTGTTHAPQPGHRGDCSPSADSSLVGVNLWHKLPSLLGRTHCLQILHLVLAIE